MIYLQDPDAQKKSPAGGFDLMVGQDGHRTPLARLSIHGAGHQTQEAPEARRSRHQSIGQAGQTARNRLQSGQDSARQVEMIKAIDRLPDSKSLAERMVKRIMQAKTRLKL